MFVLSWKARLGKRKQRSARRSLRFKGGTPIPGSSPLEAGEKGSRAGLGRYSDRGRRGEGAAGPCGSGGHGPDPQGHLTDPSEGDTVRVMNEQAMTSSLDSKVTEAFSGKVVRKDLVRKVKVGANVPVFVLEYLLGKYCASSDPMAIQMGIDVVNRTLADSYVSPDEATKGSGRAPREGAPHIHRQGHGSACCQRG